jgi:hypothetical protein
MPCNASYARFIFGKFFTSTIILYVLLFAQNFYSCKKWVLQKERRYTPERHETFRQEVTKLLEAGFIRPVDYPNRLANPVLVEKANGS